MKKTHTAICCSTANLFKSAISLYSNPVLCFNNMPSLNGKAIESITTSLICKQKLQITEYILQ